MSRWLRKAGIGLILIALALALAVLVNTLRLPGLPAAGAGLSSPPAGLDAAVKRLSAAIQVQTVSSSPMQASAENSFPAFHKLLEESFPRVHGALKREVINGSSLLYTWQGTDPSLAPILLTAHMDVVPVEPGTEGSWTHPPFSGAIADGYVWGRGAIDMKHVVMATLEGIESLLAEGGAKPKRTVLLAFGHDEEIGGEAGAKAIVDLLEQRKVRAMFSLDEGSAILDGVIPGATRQIAQIGLSEKGGLSLLLKAKAKGGHSSMPPQQTAVGKIGRAVSLLEAHQMPATLDGPGGKGLLGVAPALPFGMRVVLANQWLFGPILIRQLSASPVTNALIRTTTAPTIIQGGVKENVLPSEATAVVNFRLAPGDTVAQVKAHVEQTIADPDVTFTDWRGPGVEATSVADMNGPGYKLIAEAIHAIAPDAVVAPGLVVTGTDSKHYGRVSDAAYRFAPMRLTPPDIVRIHGTNERIGIVNYGELISFYTALVRASAM